MSSLDIFEKSVTLEKSGRSPVINSSNSVLPELSTAIGYGETLSFGFFPMTGT